MAPRIKQELLDEWKKKGELLIIWRCDRCYKKIPFYKSGNELIDSIYYWWCKDHKYCPECKKKMGKKNNPKPKEEGIEEIPKINNLLKIYESPEDDL